MPHCDHDHQGGYPRAGHPLRTAVHESDHARSPLTATAGVSLPHRSGCAAAARSSSLGPARAGCNRARIAAFASLPRDRRVVTGEVNMSIPAIHTNGCSPTRAAGAKRTALSAQSPIARLESAGRAGLCNGAGLRRGRQVQRAAPANLVSHGAAQDRVSREAARRRRSLQKDTPHRSVSQSFHDARGEPSPRFRRCRSPAAVDHEPHPA